MSVFPTLDFLQIEQRYPKAVKRIQQWLFDQEELKKMTDGFVDPKDPEGSKREFTGMLIQMDPRKLYDIFDALSINVSVFCANSEYWRYSCTSDYDMQYSAESRIEAEVSAFHDAFEKLENSL